MLKPVFALLGAIAVSASAFATTTFSGHLTWASGTLTSTVTLTGAPQTISLKVGSATDTFTDTYIPGDIGDMLESGTTMEFVEKGGVPFAGTFSSNLNMQVFAPGDGSTEAERRTIPISSTGVLQYNVAFETSYVNSLTFYVPACTEGTVSFPNGLSVNFASAVASYSLTVPTTSGTATFSTVNFPTGSSSLNYVYFFGVGNADMEFDGNSTSTTVDVAGNVIYGTGTILTDATLLFSSGN